MIVPGRLRREGHGRPGGADPPSGSWRRAAPPHDSEVDAPVVAAAAARLAVDVGDDLGVGREGGGGGNGPDDVFVASAAAAAAAAAAAPFVADVSAAEAPLPPPAAAEPAWNLL